MPSTARDVSCRFDGSFPELESHEAELKARTFFWQYTMAIAHAASSSFGPKPVFRRIVHEGPLSSS